MLNPVSAEAWLTEASPKLHTTIASSGHRVDRPSARARSIAKATPTARGRWLAIVEVCGITARPGWPNTLWRPPAIGSSAEAQSPRSTSRSPSSGARPAWAERAR